MAQQGPWLNDGWDRDYDDGTITRIPGELHRGPEGAGWSDRNLHIYLRDYIGDNPARTTQLRNAKTRRDLLLLCDGWGLPFVSQKAWLGSIDTDRAWFTVSEPVSRAFGTPYCEKRIVVVAALSALNDFARSGLRAEPVEALDAARVGGGGAALEHLYDFADVPSSSGGWVTSGTGIMVRPCVAPPGTRMLYCRGTFESEEGGPASAAGSDEGTAVLEFAPSRKIIEARQLMQTIEDVWGLRRHLQALRPMTLAGMWADDPLSPAARLDDVASTEATILPLLLCVVDLNGGSSGEVSGEVELAILRLFYDSSATCDRHAVRLLLWRQPVDGARSQVCAEGVNPRFALGVRLAAVPTFEYCRSVFSNVPGGSRCGDGQRLQWR